MVFSGFRNKELETALKTMGTKIGTSISSNTFALIVPIKTEKSTSQRATRVETPLGSLSTRVETPKGSLSEGLQQLTSEVALPPSKSGKMKEAEKYKVPIYSLDEFVTKYQITL